MIEYLIEEKDDYTDLFFLNGWKKTPPVVEFCRQHKHPIVSITSGPCVTEVRCDICKYKYFIDSSD